MFGKNKKKEIKHNTFGDNEYSMKEKYNTNELIVANLQRISSAYVPYGPIIETTNQKYIFEKIENNNNIKYREIFTGFITECLDNTDKNETTIQFFGFPYVYKPKKFTDYFPETIGIEIPKLSLIWAQNDINYPKRNDSNNIKRKKKKK